MVRQMFCDTLKLIHQNYKHLFYSIQITSNHDIVIPL